MAQYHVKNTGHLAKAFKVKGGHQVVPAGKTANVVDARELTEAQIEAFARDGVKVTAGAGPLDHDGDGNKGGAKSERDDLKARAAALKLDFPGISTVKLKELVEAEEAKPTPNAIDDMSDTELKTFLGTKGVKVTDETRDQLLELAKAA